jgi:hypothetical protein
MELMHSNQPHEWCELRRASEQKSQESIAYRLVLTMGVVGVLIPAADFGANSR